VPVDVCCDNSTTCALLTLDWQPCAVTIIFLCRYVIDGKNVVLLRTDDPDYKVDEFTFAPNTVFAIDVAFSTGEGKTRESDLRTTVYKRSQETTYSLKLKASKQVLNEVSKRFLYTPFTLRALGDETTAKLGVTECTKHGIFQPYQPLQESKGAFVAHFKFTALLLANGTLKVTGLTLPSNVHSDKPGMFSKSMQRLVSVVANFCCNSGRLCTRHDRLVVTVLQCLRA
jgi:hypothetical protein